MRDRKLRFNNLTLRTTTLKCIIINGVAFSIIFAWVWITREKPRFTIPPSIILLTYTPKKYKNYNTTTYGILYTYLKVIIEIFEVIFYNVISSNKSVNILPSDELLTIDSAYFQTLFHLNQHFLILTEHLIAKYYSLLK